MANITDKLIELSAQRVMRGLIAALETDPARACEACHGDGYVLNGNGPDEKPCAECGGVGLKPEGSGDGQR